MSSLVNDIREILRILMVAQPEINERHCSPSQGSVDLIPRVNCGEIVLQELRDSTVDRFVIQSIQEQVHQRIVSKDLHDSKFRNEKLLSKICQQNSTIDRLEMEISALKLSLLDLTKNIEALEKDKLLNEEFLNSLKNQVKMNNNLIDTCTSGLGEITSIFVNMKNHNDDYDRKILDFNSKLVSLRYNLLDGINSCRINNERCRRLKEECCVLSFQLSETKYSLQLKEKRCQELESCIVYYVKAVESLQSEKQQLQRLLLDSERRHSLSCTIIDKIKEIGQVGFADQPIKAPEGSTSSCSSNSHISELCPICERESCGIMVCSCSFLLFIIL